MASVLKKVPILIVVVFIGFYLLTDPHGLAALTKSGGGTVWSLVQHLFSGVIAFLDGLLKK